MPTTTRSKRSTSSRKAHTAAKAATKKSAPKSKGKKVLVCANNDECFWTNDGRILADLTQLRDALATMPTTVYEYHVSKEKNDFADWVEKVLRDAELAVSLRKARKPHTARSVVVRRLKFYNI